jgi:hypothetical protein
VAQGQPGQKQGTLSLKQTNGEQKGLRHAWSYRCLLSKQEALNSTSSINLKQKKRGRLWNQTEKEPLGSLNISKYTAQSYVKPSFWTVCKGDLQSRDIIALKLHSRDGSVTPTSQTITQILFFSFYKSRKLISLMIIGLIINFLSLFVKGRWLR